MGFVHDGIAVEPWAIDAVLRGCHRLPADAAAWMDAGERGDIFARACHRVGRRAFGGAWETGRCAVGIKDRVRMAAPDREISVGVLIGCAATLQHRCRPDRRDAGDRRHRLAVPVEAGIAKDVAVLAVDKDETLALVYTLLPLRHLRLFVLQLQALTNRCHSGRPPPPPAARRWLRRCLTYSCGVITSPITSTRTYCGRAASIRHDHRGRALEAEEATIISSQERTRAAQPAESGMTVARKQIDEVLGILCSRFPNAFFMHEGKRKPLAVGIGRVVEAILGNEVDRKVLHVVFRFYVNNAAYLRGLTVDAVRVDLDGNAAGVVTADQAAHAQEILAKRVKKNVTPPAPKPAPVVKPRPVRDGLAALREAAARRKSVAA